jgi:hypothetical protein
MVQLSKLIPCSYIESHTEEIGIILPRREPAELEGTVVRSPYALQLKALLS